MKAFETVLLPTFRVLMPKMISPTRDLARVLTDLACGDGGAVEGSGVSGEGRTLNNAAMRRLAGI